MFEKSRVLLVLRFTLELLKAHVSAYRAVFGSSPFEQCEVAR